MFPIRICIKLNAFEAVEYDVYDAMFDLAIEQTIYEIRTGRRKLCNNGKPVHVDDALEHISLRDVLFTIQQMGLADLQDEDYPINVKELAYEHVQEWKQQVKSTCIKQLQYERDRTING